MGRVAVVTAISGVGRHEWLSKLAHFLPPEWLVVNFESEYLARSLARVSGRPQDAPLHDLLNIPEPFVRDAWDEAFEEFMDTIGGTGKGQNMVLSMHASIWSPESTSPFPIVNPALVVKRNLRADIVLNVVDDIWDINSRLHKPRQLFELIGYRQLGSAIDNLMTLLEWRHIEFRASEILAKCCGAQETILLSAKHPISTMQRLICGDTKPRVYLSHPISAPRQEESFPDTCTVKDIQRLAAALRRKLILFEPTGIDELRLIEGPDGKMQATKRWPQFLDTNGEAEEPCARAPGGSGAFNTRDLELKHVASLIERIDSQVNWRDRQLVEQSDSIVAIRPFSGTSAEMSNGVYEELRLHAVLCERYSERRRGVILHRSDDERRRRIHLVCKILDDIYYSANHAGTQGETWASYLSVATQLVDNLTETLTYSILDHKVRECCSDVALTVEDPTSRNLGKHRRVEQPSRMLQLAAVMVDDARHGRHEEILLEYEQSTLAIADEIPGYEVILIEDVETDYENLSDEIVQVISRI